MKKYILIVLLLIILFTASSCKQNNKPITKTEFLMDTYVSITVYDSKDETLIDEAFQLCRDYESLLSKTSENGDISKIQNKRYNYVNVSSHTLDILEIYISLYESSEYKFDCTLGAVNSLWNFNNKRLPDDELLTENIRHVGMENLVIENDKVILNSEYVCLDFGAVAKGYISEKIKEYLINNGVDHALLNFGGNVVTIGNKPDGTKYKIGIYKPFSENNETICAVSINNKALVTAGIYERYIEENGKIYHHIIDPKTGYAVETDLFSASVICDDAALADAYSTICILLGSEKALNFINNIENAEAIFINENYEIILSTNADKYLLEE